MPAKCVILDDYQHAANKMADWQTLDNALTVEFLHHHIDGPPLVAALQQATVIVAMRERTVIDRALLAELPCLQLIVTSGMRNAAIDLAAAKEKGVKVCGTASGSEPPAELTWSLLLALAKNLVTEQSNLGNGGPWQSTVGSTLAGKNLGIIGLGKIGKRIARYAQAFDMNVYAWSPNLTAQRAQEAGVNFVAEKSALLAESDFVTLHLVCSPATQGIISWHDLQQMKPSAYLVNTSRAALIEPGALLRALEENIIAGAATDVFEEEPLAADSPYRRARNLLATPHLGYVSDSNYRLYFSQAIENINAWLAGQPIREL